MKKYEAKTVEAAKMLACAELMIEPESFMFEVLDGKEGFFRQKAVILAYDLSDVIEFVENYLKNAI